MEQSMDLTSKIKTPTSPDRTSNLFKVVDDLNHNFKEKLAEAQAKHEPEQGKEADKTKSADARVPEEKVENEVKSERTELEDTSEAVEETIEELTDGEEAKAQEEQEEALDGDESGQQNQQDDSSDDVEEGSQEQELEDQAPEQEGEAPEELLNHEDEELPQEELEEDELPQDEASEEESPEDQLDAEPDNILEDGDERAALTKEEALAKKQTKKGSVKNAPLTEVQNQDKGSSEKAKPSIESLRSAEATEKAPLENKVKLTQGSPSSKAVEKLALNELSQSAKQLDESSIQQMVDEDGMQELDTKPRLREQSAQKTDESSRFLFQSEESSNRSGTATKAAENQMQPLHKVLDGLNQVANQINIQKPNLEKLSNELLNSVKQTYQQAKGAIAPVQNSEVKAAQAPLRQFSAEKSLFQSDKLNELKDKVMQQVRYHLKLAMKNGLGEVKMRLNPQFLGGMKVNLMMGQNDVSATFLVENQSVKEILQRSLHNLEQTLSEKGIDVDRIDVKVSSEDLTQDTSERGSQMLEDQKVKRQWIHSFKNFGILGESLSVEDDSEIKPANENELNIVA